MGWTLLSDQENEQVAFAKVIKHLSLNFLLKPLSIKFEKNSVEELTICYEVANSMAVIRGSHEVHLYRGLGLLAEMQQSGEDSYYHETMQFQELNFMLDASRNAVMKVNQVKEFIVIMSLMGYTGLYLYIEDTYELSEQPYFGYLRGKYLTEELKEIDEFASLFGIEVVPCIQTLAHLTQVLRWETYSSIREDGDTLLVGENGTYELIRHMLETINKTFSSGKVHLGMDESFGVGIGQYLEKNPYKERFTLIKDHLEQVVELAQRIGLSPLVWSDFIYHTLDQKKIPGYYPVEAVIDQQRAKTMPQEVTYVYWDYGEFEPQKYEQRLVNHWKFAADVMFAGGIHIYGATTPNHGKSLKTLNPALMACKKMAVKKVMATTWGDDGQEIAHWNALPIMQWYAEHTYNATAIKNEEVATRFATCVAPKLYEGMMAVRYLDEVPGVEELNHYMANPSKFLLWQDPLVGLFEGHVLDYQKSGDLVEHYKTMVERLAKAKKDAVGIMALNLDVYVKLAEVLSLKATFGIELINAYQAQERVLLKQLVEERLPLILLSVEALRESHELIWLATYKPFGWETLDIRYGGLIQRLKSSQQRLRKYLIGDILDLPELDEERLPFLQGTSPLSINVPTYRRIAFTGYN